MIFFFWGWYFFFGRRPKKILSQQKKNTHQQTKLLIQRKHLYAYDMTFLCPPPPSPTKKYPIKYTLFFFLGWYFFLPKKTSLLWYFQPVTFHFIFHSRLVIAFFLPIWAFRSFWNCQNHDFFLKTIETWYKFLIVILFFKKEKINEPIFSNTLRKNNINI